MSEPPPPPPPGDAELLSKSLEMSAAHDDMVQKRTPQGPQREDWCLPSWVYPVEVLHHLLGAKAEQHVLASSSSSKQQQAAGA